MKRSKVGNKATVGIHDILGLRKLYHKPITRKIAVGAVTVMVTVAPAIVYGCAVK